MATKADYRLSSNVQPIHYDLTLSPDLSAFTFIGEETVELEIAAPTRTISMNAIDLEITSADVTPAGGTATVAEGMDFNEELETVTFTFGQELPSGRAWLNVHFTGTLNDQLRGFYRSRYTGMDGKDRYLATTQFEATDARRAFPCWDDPAVKATFQVTLVVPSDLAAISNTLIDEETPATNGTKTVRFKPIPKMSTYLLAFVVGDMACVEAEADNGTLMRVWTTKGKEEQGKFALENSVKLLKYYNNYFGIPFPLEKLDHIAVPDFAAGAMENWGAITYRETALLFDPENSAAAARQRILEVVSHEMAHMWFGDLVTMEWWDDLWLNESFASWMGDKAVDAIYPEWTMWTQFVSHDTNRALSLDGLRNSHPIEANVKDPAEIRELFDAISYSKGGSVLRMLEHFLSEETFRQGLRLYLNTHKYANAQTVDLWTALEETSGKPVTAVMDSWVKQTGYPILNVETKRSGTGVDVTLTQRRFLYDHVLDEKVTDETTWQVPVSIVTSKGSRVSTLMEGQSATLSTADASSWVKANAGQTGFLRVNYSDDEWARLRKAIANNELSATDRMGLQNDAYALVRSGMAPATMFLELAEAFQEEEDGTVWSDLAANLRGLEAMITDEPYRDAFEAYGRSLFEGAAGRVGWDASPEEGHLDSIKRSVLLGQAGAYRDGAVIAEAKARFDQYVTNAASLSPDLRGVVLGLAAQEGDSGTFETLWSLERQAELQEEKMRFMGALSRFQDQGLLQSNLNRAMDPNEIRGQDTVLFINAIAGNRLGRDLAWDFIMKNWDEFDRRYGKGGFAIMNLVSVTGSFTTLEKAQEVDEFFKANPAPSAARTIQQSLERIKLNHSWLRRNSDSLARWFAAR